MALLVSYICAMHASCLDVGLVSLRQWQHRNQPANVTVVVRVRPPESGLANKHVVGVFPAIGAHDTIIVDRDGSEARWALCVYRAS